MSHATTVPAGRGEDSVRAASSHPAAAQGWETSYWPAVIGFGILLLPLAFSFHFVYQRPLAAVVSAGIGVPLIVAGIVGWVREALGHRGEGLGAPAMGWFIVAEALIFLSFFSAYWTVRIAAPAWPPAGTPPLPVVLPLAMTAILVASSFTIHLAEVRHARGDHHGFVGWLGVTMLLGIAFLGCTAYEWRELIHEGFTPAANVFGTMFFSLTGFHAGHVFVGVAVFLAMLLPALFGRSDRHFLAAGALYWHFVDVVWLFVVSQVYFW